MRILLNTIILIIFFVSCKSDIDNKKKELNTSVVQINIDTLKNDNYYWPFCITVNNELFLIKEENKFFKENRFIFRIPIVYGPEKFTVVKDYLAFEYIDSNYINIINIYNLKDHICKINLNNFHIIDELYEENKLIVAKNNDSFNLYLFDINKDSLIYEFKNNENYPIINASNIYLYDATFNTKEGENLIVKTFDINTLSVKKEFTLKCKGSNEVLFILGNKYIVTDQNKILFYDFYGNIICEWPLLLERDFQALTLKDTLYLYNWCGKDQDERDVYYFVKQSIPLVCPTNMHH